MAMKKANAVVVTTGFLNTPFAKTAHGLIRGSERFNVVALIDKDFVGEDAGELLDGMQRGIPIHENIQEVLQLPDRPTHCIVGVATPGGFLPPAIKDTLKMAIKSGLNLVNGLHYFFSEDEEFCALANQYQVEIIDIRKPKSRNLLSFWSGKISSVKIPRVAVLGTDCAIGKRTTTKLLTDQLNERGIHAEMIYTGQTGWLQGAKHGFIFDSTINDFISGEIEKALVECAEVSAPEVMIVEGQSSLLNPTGPCGSEFILSGQVKGVVLQHAPGRENYEDTDIRIPPIQKEVALIKLLGAEVIAITLNEHGVSEERLLDYKASLEKNLNIPVILPLSKEIDRLAIVVEAFMAKSS